VQAVSVFAFGGLPRDLIHRFKYQRHSYLAPVLAARMVRNWQRHGGGQADSVVPVPLHWVREIFRGYNQAELLARHVGLALDLPVQLAVRRRRWTARQAMLDFSRRQTNVRGVFQMRMSSGLAGRHVLVVDDVLTTGATLSAVTEVLLEAGVAAVSLLTAARG
jgi:ComF family protein